MNDPLENYIKELEKAKRTLQSKGNVKVIANFIADKIKLRTRLGYGVARDGAVKYKLAPLKDSTIDRREDLEDRGRLSDKTRATRSNLTETAEMLDSIKGKAIAKGRGKVYLKGEHKGAGISNSKLADYHEKGSSNKVPRPFFHISKVEQKAYHRKVRLQLQELLRKIF